MRNLLNLLVFIMAITLTFVSCSKEGPMGPVGPEGAPGPDALSKTYTLLFDGTTTWAVYVGFEGEYQGNDVVLSYVSWSNFGGDDYYVQLPYSDATTNWSLYTEVNNISGALFQNIENASGGVAVTSASNITYKSVLIKGRALEGIPDNFDFSDYNKVKSHFRLEED